MSRHNRPVTSSYCAKKTKTTNKHFISLLVQEMHCVIFFFVSSGTSNHTKGVIRFQEGSEHPSSHSFSSHLHLQTKWKSISLKKVQIRVNIFIAEPEVWNQLTEQLLTHGTMSLSEIASSVPLSSRVLDWALKTTGESLVMEVKILTDYTLQFFTESFMS